MNNLRSVHVRRLLVPVTAVSMLSACFQFKYQETAASEVIAEGSPSQVRLIMLDGDSVYLEQPSVSGDRIVGRPYDRQTSVVSSHTVRLATDSVAEMQVVGVSTGDTIAGIVAALAVGGLVTWWYFETLKNVTKDWWP